MFVETLEPAADLALADNAAVVVVAAVVPPPPPAADLAVLVPAVAAIVALVISAAVAAAVAATVVAVATAAFDPFDVFHQTFLVVAVVVVPDLASSLWGNV